MTKYELEKVKSLLEMVRELTFQHIPNMYASEISAETIKAIKKIDEDIKKANN